MFLSELHFDHTIHQNSCNYFKQALKWKKMTFNQLIPHNLLYSSIILKFIATHKSKPRAKERINATEWLKCARQWKGFSIHYLSFSNSPERLQVEPWTTQRLPIWVWLLTPQYFTNNLLLTGNLTDITNSQLIYILYVIYYILTIKLKKPSIKKITRENTSLVLYCTISMY